MMIILKIIFMTMIKIKTKMTMLLRYDNSYDECDDGLKDDDDDSRCL
jgi:hypothetical protein